ncbi:MAG: hypothetical protein K0R34_3911 [Herbinix sp.]|jgi:uncharacterized membrane protein YdjX (TVP38/TMEM64 family)|nr:hypothetical protein [Herbinix sp.]
MKNWILDILYEYNNIAIFLSLIISLVVALSGILPSIFVTSINVLFFGIYKGLIISWLGEVIGAAITFKLYRWGIKKHTERLAGKYHFLSKITSAEGVRATILILEARLIPYIPSGLVTLAGAVSNIRTSHFIVATAIGKLPSIVLEVFVAYQIVHLSDFWIGILFLFIFIITIIWMKNSHK